MTEHLDEIDIKTYDNLKEYLDKHENQELDEIFEYIKDSLSNGIYPYAYLYKAKQELDRIDQIERIKLLDKQIEALEQSNIDLKEAIQNIQKRGSKSI